MVSVEETTPTQPPPPALATKFNSSCVTQPPSNLSRGPLASSVGAILLYRRRKWRKTPSPPLCALLPAELSSIQHCAHSSVQRIIWPTPCRAQLPPSLHLLSTFFPFSSHLLISLNWISLYSVSLFLFSLFFIVITYYNVSSFADWRYMHTLSCPIFEHKHNCPVPESNIHRI